MRFSEIPGHQNIKERLTALIDNGRMPHALLLEGPSGVGKFALARAAVQYLHCTDRHNGDSCGKCPSCIQHQTFNHIDTIYSFPILKNGSIALSDDFIKQWRDFLVKSPYMDFSLWQRMLGKADGQPKIYVDESQDLIRKLNFTSHSSDDKVVLMWLPEKMNIQCANKLLKMIEEPLPGVKLMFVSNNSAEILPTIYSRMQRIEVKRLPDYEVSRYLQTNYSIPPADADAQAYLASGSIVKAISNLGKESDAMQYLGFFIQLMRLAYQKEVGALRKWSLEIAGLGRESIAKFCTYCQQQLRENFIANIRVDSLNHMRSDEKAFSSRFSPFINERNVEQLNSIFGKAREDVLANGNSKIIFFDVAVKVILLLKK